MKINGFSLTNCVFITEDYMCCILSLNPSITLHFPSICITRPIIFILVNYATQRSKHNGDFFFLSLAYISDVLANR